MARIAVGGFLHETNTFAPTLATFAEFERPGRGPGLVRGEEIFDKIARKNIALEGFIQAVRQDGHQLIPLLWCSATPSSFVTKDAFERITTMLCEDLAKNGPLDAVYLDLHGAMVAEHFDDGEGETLARVREVVGMEIPVVNSLDLHANITPRMIEMSSAMTIFRTYPHIDIAVTGGRTYPLLKKLLDGETLTKAFGQAPFLVPLTAQWTGTEPNRSFYKRIVQLEEEGLTSADLALAFPAADIYDCGPAVVAYDPDPTRAKAAVDDILALFLKAESNFENRMFLPDDAVREAMAEPDGPVVLADAQDNPGCGGSSDTVGLLEALVRNGAQRAVLGLLNDPEMAARAHVAGVSASIEGELGGKSGQAGQSPFIGKFLVERLGDGIFDLTGEMGRGGRAHIGRTTVLKVDHPDCDVRVVVSSQRMQNLDQACFRHIGIEPTEQKILAIKSTTHFRADYDPIASKTILVEAPGTFPCRLTTLKYRNLRQGIRLGPLGPAH